MEFTGKTVEEAVEEGLKVLGVSKDDAEITVLTEPQKGLFGKIKVEAKVDVAPKAKVSESGSTVEFVKKVLSYLDVAVYADVNEQEDKTVITLTSDDSAFLIGKRGEVLDAIQTLAGAKENIGKKQYKKVIIDCENYRENRELTLINLANKLADKATEMRRDVILEPMNPYDRRIIHAALADSDKVTTISEGKEPNRYVIIVPNDREEFAKPYNAARNNDKKGGHNNYKGKNGKGNNKKGGYKKSGFSEQTKKPSFSFGAYLGNSFKDKM